jgi:hypothetical protein
LRAIGRPKQNRDTLTLQSNEETMTHCDTRAGGQPDQDREEEYVTVKRSDLEHILTFLEKVDRLLSSQSP